MEAFVFPGQGSQFAGMGRDLHEAVPEARAVFEEADKALGFPLSQLCFEGPDEQLELTENTQPAILTVSVALFRALRARGKRPSLVAGHSLGEYSALVAAGCLRFADAVRIVRKRGRFMQKAVPLGTGAMAAILGLEAAAVQDACRQAAQGEIVEPANYNSAQQIVIAGHAAAVERACQAALQGGARYAKPLKVSAPFHCALMKPAQDKLEAELSGTEFSDLSVPLVNNAQAQVVRTGEEARQGLIQQVSSAVLWTQSVEAMSEQGVTRFVEVGPGKVLTGLIKRIARQSERISIFDCKQLEAYV
ncbi:MAG: ACP S-malonyltransferase [Acidobacteriota bacterium]